MTKGSPEKLAAIKTLLTVKIMALVRHHKSHTSTLSRHTFLVEPKRSTSTQEVTGARTIQIEAQGVEEGVAEVEASTSTSE